MLWYVHIVAVTGIVQQFAQVVECLQNNADHIRRGDNLIIADHIENIFNFMGKFFDIIQAEKTSAALYGMGGPEHFVDKVFVNLFALLFNYQQVALYGFQMLLGFLNIHLQGFVID